MKKIPPCSGKELQERIRKLLSRPEFPDKEFTLSGRTYAETYEMASELQEAFSLIHHQNRPICLCADDRAIMMAAFLAALASGGPPLIIPYSDSAAVLSEMHAQTGYDTAVCDQEKEVPPGVTTIIPKAGTGKQSIPKLETAIDLNREFLFLFTGGSTGKPQVWPKTVRNLFSEVFYHIEKHALSAQDRFVATVPPHHIYGLLFSVLVPFAVSAGIASETITFPQEIVSAVQQQDATIMVSVPMHYKALCGHPIPDHSLRLALSSAGVLDKTDNERFCSLNHTGILEIYGSTETGGIAFRCRANGEAAFTAFDTIDIKIPDEKIHVRSDYISPNVNREPDGYFQTGDCGRDLGGSRFELLGRSDGIVKIGGKRVDLQEIREKIMQLQEVQDAVILSSPAPSGREAEITAVIEGDVTASAIRNHLATHLEPYARPRRYRIVPRIPKNRLGKIDMEQVEKWFEKA
ncbi:MAG: fatty acid--CoA ligase family protein [Desulfobacterales bacterium]